MAITACRACGAALLPEVIVLREMMFGTRETFPYHRCGACGSLSIDEVPDDLDRHYPSAYYSNQARFDLPDAPAWARPLREALVAERAFGRRSPLLALARRMTALPREYAQVRAIVEDGGLASFDDPVLDVGCGAMPARLAALRALGFRRVEGAEPFIAADTVYRGVPVRRAVIEDVAGSFALIMFHHSLEHVPDPIASLRAAADRLRPGGRCLVRTPMMGTTLWRLYGPEWVELDAPRHLVLFSPDGLERAARLAGLEVERHAWESGAWEFIASEQYRHDIAMYEAGSWFVDKTGMTFDDATLTGFKATARRLTEEGEAGRAAIWLRRAEDPAS